MKSIFCQPGGFMYKKINYGSKSIPIKVLKLNQINVKYKLNSHNTIPVEPHTQPIGKFPLGHD